MNKKIIDEEGKYCMPHPPLLKLDRVGPVDNRPSTLSPPQKKMGGFEHCIKISGLMVWV